jgi:hypothetical protein
MLRPMRQPIVRFVDDLIAAAHYTGEDEAIAAAAPMQWTTGLALVAEADEERRIYGYVLVLAALNRAPEILRRLATRLGHTRCRPAEPRHERAVGARRGRRPHVR